MLKQSAGPRRWLLAVVAALSLVTGTTGQAATSIPQGALVEVDEATVTQILDVFHKADAAVAVGNLDGVMALYATPYNYHGLKQADVRKIWFDLFEEYRDISDVHFFSKIVKVGAGSGCRSTGWYEEVHYLTFEHDSWQIRGNVGDSPKVMPFGTAPHPLF